jgi:hypothetical protein
MFNRKSIQKQIHQNKREIIRVILIVWLSYTVYYGFVFFSSSNYIVSFLWGDYNLYILITLLTCFIWVQLKIESKRNLKILRLIFSIFMIIVFVFILLNGVARIYNSFVFHKNISTISMNNKNLLRLHAIEDIDPENNDYNYEIKKESYQRKDGFLFKEYYETSEVVTYKEPTLSDVNYASLLIKYYKLSLEQLTKHTAGELSNEIVENYLSFNELDTDLNICKIIVNDSWVFVFDNLTLKSKDFIFYSDNTIIQLKYMGDASINKIIEEVMSLQLM